MHYKRNRNNSSCHILYLGPFFFLDQIIVELFSEQSLHYFHFDGEIEQREPYKPEVRVVKARHIIVDQSDDSHKEVQNQSEDTRRIEIQAELIENKDNY